MLVLCLREVPRPEGAWIDAVTGRHSARDSELLLQRRRLMYHKSFGWCYDVWPEKASSYALSGANGRYRLQNINANSFCHEVHPHVVI